MDRGLQKYYFEPNIIYKFMDADEPLLEPTTFAARPTATGRVCRRLYKFCERHIRIAGGLSAACCGLGAVALLSLAFAAALDKHTPNSMHWFHIFLGAWGAFVGLWAFALTPYVALRIYDRLQKDERADKLRRDVELAQAAQRGFELGRGVPPLEPLLSEEEGRTAL